MKPAHLISTWLRRASAIIRRYWAVAAGAAAVFAVILANAWITEDTFISLRAAKNLLAGYGPVWNLDYRVQVFTHPLWMALLTLCQGLFPGNTPLAVIWLGIITTLIAVILLLKDVTSRWLILPVVIALVSSKAFIDYATSGLENPLLYILVILFAHEYLGKQRVFWLTLIASLAAITRADAVALLLPAFIPLIWHHWRQRAFWLDVLKGAIPLILWELFSLVYFGYLLPNTIFAKTLTYIPAPIMSQHALEYFANSLDWDKITLPLIALALVLTDLTRRRRELFLAAGIVLYLLAVFHSGGDYMSGRFFAVPFFLSVYLVVRWLQDLRTTKLAPRLRRYAIPVFTATAIALALLTPWSPVVHPITAHINRIDDFDKFHGDGNITDEARIYCPNTCLANLSHLKRDPQYRQLDHVKPGSTVVLKSIGMIGYYGDPKTHIVDQLALADPLLSHLSADPKSRIGHFRRDLPDGYLDSLSTGQNVITDACIHRLYDDIRPVVTGPLFTLERAKNIIKLNSGYSDLKYERCVRRG